MFSLSLTFVSSSTLYTPVQRHVSLATSEVLLSLDADLHPGEEGGTGPAHGHQLQLARLVPLPQLGQPPLVGRHPRRQLLAPPRVLLVVEQRQEVRQGLCVQPRGGLRVPRTVRGDGLHSAGEVTTRRPREVRSPGSPTWRPSGNCSHPAGVANREMDGRRSLENQFFSPDI